MSVRLDVLIAACSLARSRTQAAELVAAGRVRVNGALANKPSQMVPPDAELQVLPPDFLSRGGQKLHHALGAFGITVSGRPALDVGASTGGFTQALLLAGAPHVYAVDVGRDQLDSSLRADGRVSDMSGLNARDLAPRHFPAPPEVCGVDVSFISLRLILPAVAACLAENADLVALVKPQFEAGRAALNRHGVVRDPADQLRALREVTQAALACGLHAQGVVPSPVRGGSGNTEYLLHLRREAPREPLPPEAFRQAVRSAQSIT